MGALTPEERQEALFSVVGGPEGWAAYVAAGEALHAFARLIPGTLGLNVADIYKETGVRLQQALADAERAKR